MHAIHDASQIASCMHAPTCLLPAKPESSCCRFKYDSVHKTWPGTVEAKGGGLIIDGHRIKGSSMSDPAQIPWADAGVDYGGFSVRKLLLASLLLAPRKAHGCTLVWI